MIVAAVGQGLDGWAMGGGGGSHAVVSRIALAARLFLQLFSLRIVLLFLFVLF